MLACLLGLVGAVTSAKLVMAQTPSPPPVDKSATAAAPVEELVEPAEASRPATAEALDRLRTARNFTPRGLPERQSSTDALRAILARSEFNSEGFSDAGPGPLERFFAWLQQLLSRTGIQGGGATVVILTSLLVLAVSYLIFRLVWELFQRRTIRDRAKVDTVPENMSAAALLASAEQAAASGDFRSAIRWRFLALVKQLDLPSATVLTNSQLARLVRKQYGGTAAQPFVSAAASFEDVWYGGLACGREHYDRITALAGEAARVWLAAIAAEQAAEARP